MSTATGTRQRRHVLPAGWAAAGTVLLVLLVSAGRYGLHGDELYFRMLPLHWWYDDQPPLTVWLSNLAAAISDAGWVQRVPAALGAAVGALVAAAFPRLLGYGRRVQNVAAWAHAFTVYPLIVGHVFLTSSLDLLAWQLVVLLVVAATLGRRDALVWAGVIAGLACWNKLLVLPLVGALALSLLLLRRDLFFSRQAVGAAVACAVIGAPQVLAQAVHGWPMRYVSGDLIVRNGDLNRWLVLPLLVAFVGPPLFGVCLRGLRWRPEGEAWPGLLLPAGVVLVVWNLTAPAQPYYAIGLFLCALAMGWGAAARDGSVVWRHAPGVIAANGVVAALLALPILPVPSTAYDVASTINPVARDRVGWTGYVDQVDAARGGAGVTVVTDAYSLAGAVDYYGEARGGIPVASGHNALWRMGPPAGDEVLLVGPRAVALSSEFVRCTGAGRLTETESDPFGVAGSPMARCSTPLGGWESVWPQFRHLGA